MTQQVQLLGGLGIIPTYQFSSDPAVNPFGVNPHVQFPEGWNQMTVQPVGQYIQSGDQQLQGLGYNWWQPGYWKPSVTARRSGGQASCPTGCGYDGTRCVCTDVSRTFRGLGTPMVAWLPKPVGLYGVFDSGWWQNRKWLALGLLGVVGAGAAAFAVKVLR